LHRVIANHEGRLPDHAIAAHPQARRPAGPAPGTAGKGQPRPGAMPVRTLLLRLNRCRSPGRKIRKSPDSVDCVRAQALFPRDGLFLWFDSRDALRFRGLRD
jgi:hypothetical protein